MYYIKGNNFGSKSVYFIKSKVKLILFLSQLFKDAETKYWLIELEIINLVWIVKKVWHMIELFKMFIIIYINYGASVGIIKQTLLIMSFTDKFNLHLVCALKYL